MLHQRYIEALHGVFSSLFNKDYTCVLIGADHSEGAKPFPDAIFDLFFAPDEDSITGAYIEPSLDYSGLFDDCKCHSL